MSDHVHEWHWSVSVPLICECGAALLPDDIERIVNATERLSARHAKVVGDMAQQYANKVTDVPGVLLASVAALAYASALEGEDE